MVAIFFFVVLELELRAFTLSHSTSPIFVKGPANYLPGLALNCHPPDLCFLSSLELQTRATGARL
jgi:hypothetical protein